MVDLTNTTLQRDELELHHIHAISAVPIDSFHSVYAKTSGTDQLFGIGHSTKC